MIRMPILGAVLLVALPVRAGDDPGFGLPECPANQPTTFKCYNRGWQLPEGPRVGHRIPGCIINSTPGIHDPVSRCTDKGDRQTTANGASACYQRDIDVISAT
jgi:hypothetical protein